MNDTDYFHAAIAICVYSCYILYTSRVMQFDDGIYGDGREVL